MKSVNKSISKEYISSRLFIEDLENIEQILSECKDFEIVVDNFSYQSTNDLTTNKKGEQLQNLSIGTSNPYFSLRLSNDGAFLYSSSNDSQSTGIFAKINSIMIMARLKPNFFYSYYFVFVANFMLVAGNLIVPEFETILNFISYILLAWLLWVVYVRIYKSSILILVKKKDRINFFKRNSDSLILIVFTAIITYLVTTYVPKIVDFIKNSNYLP